VSDWHIRVLHPDLNKYINLNNFMWNMNILRITSLPQNSIILFEREGTPTRHKIFTPERDYVKQISFRRGTTRSNIMLIWGTGFSRFGAIHLLRALCLRGLRVVFASLFFLPYNISEMPFSIIDTVWKYTPFRSWNNKKTAKSDWFYPVLLDR